MFFGSYRKGKYRTFNIETESSYAETHPKTPTPHFNLMNVTATIFLIWQCKTKRNVKHVKEIYVISIYLFDSGILLIIDLNKKKGEKRGVNFFCEFYS